MAASVLFAVLNILLVELVVTANSCLCMCLQVLAQQTVLLAKRSSIQTIETQLGECLASSQSARAQLQKEAASLASLRKGVDSQTHSLKEERAMKSREFMEFESQYHLNDSKYEDRARQLRSQMSQLQESRGQVLSRVDQIASKHEEDKKLLQSSWTKSIIEAVEVEACIAAELVRMKTSIAGILASADDYSKLKKERALKKAETAALEAKRAAEECEAEDAEMARLQALMCVP